jgi:nucleotide sugar dehydrogenase
VLDLTAERAIDLATVARPETTPSVAIVGLGYVGLPTALGLHETGARVIGLDVSEPRLDAIRRREVDLVADDHERLAIALTSDAFRITADARELADADVVIVCVPTPVDEHLVPDLGALRGACATVVANARAGQTVILTSTSYVGSTRDLVATPLAARGLVAGSDVHVAFSPERIDPGNVRFPQTVVPRVVGGVTPGCTQRAAAIIGRVAPTHLVSSPEVAEMTKLFENSFRAVNIALANEMETASHSLGIAFDEVLAAASTKPFGFMPFRAGTGVGGHCIPCDPHYLLWQLKSLRGSAPVLEHAMTAIAERPGEIVRRAVDQLAERGVAIRGARVLVLGVTYKPGVDDIRESPAIDILRELLDRGARAEYADPRAPELRLGDGRVLTAVPDPASEAFDLVIVHALHPGHDHEWLADHEILDPSGRAEELIGVVRARGRIALSG